MLAISIKWFYLCNLAICHILSLFLCNSTLMMAAETTKTCGWLIIYMKAYFTNVHLLVHYTSVNRFLLLFLFMI